MYAVISRPFERRTRAILRSAEFGFFGVVVFTTRQTPRFWGHACSTGLLDRLRTLRRPLRTSWLIVGMRDPGGEPGNVPAPPRGGKRRRPRARNRPRRADRRAGREPRKRGSRPPRRRRGGP